MPPFAYLHRHGADHVDVLTGDVVTVPTLADIPLTPGAQTLAVIPYRQIAERGFDCVDDGAPLECLRVATHKKLPLDAFPELPLRLSDGADLPLQDSDGAGLPLQDSDGADLPLRISGGAGLPLRSSDGAFDLSDEQYGEIVDAVLRDEIGRGEGANFVIHRVFTATVDGDPIAAAKGAFGRLLAGEQGAYWTFLVHTGTRTLVGATPERHVSVAGGRTMMNPISGTLRHGSRDVLDFLSDPKEIEELYMVLDEELKMMAVIAEHGGQVFGPYLKRMTHLTHTEYLLSGRGSMDVRDVLRATMFAPTVTGSPIENACRVIARHERRGRGYYAGVLALLGHDDAGRQTLDAPILIRTAEISPDGTLRLSVGATLVRHSTPEGEVAETHTKAAGVLAALGLRSVPSGTAEPIGPAAPRPRQPDSAEIQAAGGAPRPPRSELAEIQAPGPTAPRPPRPEPAEIQTPSPTAPQPPRREPAEIQTPSPTAPQPPRPEPAEIQAPSPAPRPPRPESAEIEAALAGRNTGLARFWLDQRRPGEIEVPALSGRTATIVDAEDTFTAMLAHQLRALGLSVSIVPWHSPGALDADLVVVGPGPGDPGAPDDPKMIVLRALVPELLAVRRPTLAICLGHQVLAHTLGLPLRRRDAPYQGLARDIDLFGATRRVGFYSSFTAISDTASLATPYGPVEIARDRSDGSVHAIRGEAFAGVQFHAESVLSRDGLTVLVELLTPMLGPLAGASSAAGTTPSTAWTASSGAGTAASAVGTASSAQGTATSAAWTASSAAGTATSAAGTATSRAASSLRAGT
jgi:2-amino-4-deoxychorismate synthase